MTTEAQAATAISEYVSDHLAAVADQMQNTVIADLPHIFQAIVQTQDVGELQAGVRQSIQKGALSIALALQVELSGSGKEAVTDMIERLKALREGME